MKDLQLWGWSCIPTVPAAEEEKIYLLLYLLLPTPTSVWQKDEEQLHFHEHGNEVPPLWLSGAL